ncbi:MAG TPA: J domain-containing protein [Candidatus Saccharimonadales bacterium]|nr:J domain-containing protein [Candidatus Saccharimonadales bacterium]
MPKVVFKDHYVVLGIECDATIDTIKKAFRRLARQVHPDCLGSDAPKDALDTAAELFKDIGLAYEQLSDDKIRQEIDLWLQSTHRPHISHSNSTYSRPTVPAAGQHNLNGVWCWIEFHASGWYGDIRATVTVQFEDLFRLAESALQDLPHGA